MKFEVRYASGARHEVALEGTLVVLGRDPSCDLVLNDIKCSRRHAVVEAGPQGLAIRDTGSANGVHLNGRRVERSALAPGDLIRLGEVVIKVLPEEYGGTLAMGPEELADLAGQPAAPAPGASAARPASAAAAAGPAARQPRPAPIPTGKQRQPDGLPTAWQAPPATTLNLLVGLWCLAAPLYAGGGLWLALRAGLGRAAAAGSAVAGLGLALFALLMAFGLWKRRPWARLAQLAIAALGLLVCPFALASVTLLIYLLRPEGRAHFGAADVPADAGAWPTVTGNDSAEPAFAGTLLGTTALGLLCSLGLGIWLAPRLTPQPTPALVDQAVGDLRAVIAAQRNFRDGTASNCGLTFADLDGLLRPAEVIPNYRPDAPAFLPREFEQPVRRGFRYELAVFDAVPPTPDCPRRAFRGFRYTATPLSGQGTHLLAGPDAKVHLALDRPATFTDPTVE